ncbi:arylsulfatase [Pontibacter flavimaris]|uniref:Chloramphenicol resistance protein n=1 Tax=Pontibacter flavimaris TaxID=1797110 RepID=A0A1Q5PCZ5_9BACT|nr:arylsulfatase [Pontibacter flavimaris]OKL40096.1 chloramphenicol resistance protein [Pontibacter flavimaris]
MKISTTNLFILLALIGFSCRSAAPETEGTITAAKPNIVFILADDLGYGDIGPYGQTKIKTPNLDKMAEQGRRYTQFYAGSTVCAPSRAALMTGQHTGHGYIRGNGEVPMRATDIALPKLLKESGYTTGMVGKWGLGLEGTTGVPEQQGWDFFTGHLHHLEGHKQQADSLWRLADGTSTKVPVPQGSFVNDIFTEDALAFIEEQKSNPFFLYVSYTLPHAELKVQDKYMQPYLTADGGSIFAPEVAQKPGQWYGPQPYPKAAYAAMVTAMDDYVGQIMQKLKEQGLAENTLVIFTSDNGTHIEGGRTLADAMEAHKSSGPLRGVKRDLYEGGIRVPFIAYWEGKIKPGTSDYIGAFWDLLPTFTQLAGSASPESIDGISIVPDLLGKKEQPQHQALYWEFGEGGFKQAVRQGDWKAIRFYKNGQPERTELYNLSTDIGEQNNLAAANPEKVKELEQLMEQMRTPAENPLFQIK